MPEYDVTVVEKVIVSYRVEAETKAEAKRKVAANPVAYQWSEGTDTIWTQAQSRWEVEEVEDD